MSETLTVEAVAKTGQGFMSGDVWYNADKKSNVSFAGLKKGDVLKIEDKNGTWIKSYTLVGNGPTNTATQAVKTSQPTDRDGMIARSTVVKAFSSAFANAVKDMGADEGYQFFKTHAHDLEQYIVTGTFPSENI